MNGSAIRGEAPAAVLNRRRGMPWLAMIWVAFLLQPAATAWGRRAEPTGVLGLAATIAFVLVYLLLWLGVRSDRWALLTGPAPRWMYAVFASQVLLAALMVWALGANGANAIVFVAVGAILVLPGRVSLPVVVLLAVAVLVAGALLRSWDSGIGLAFGIGAASLALYGIIGMLRRSLALERANRENADLAVENERIRMARDLHDILGHSLTVITVKAELAQRLLDTDSVRVRAELADLERLSRDALADVRRTVEAYRDLTLPGELARARMALEAAQIEAELPHATDDVPTELRELFAWTVREGVTNVIRHSGARHCRVSLAAASVSVCDDGRGRTGEPDGAGINGLRERAAACGATLITEDREPGFALTVVRR